MSAISNAAIATHVYGNRPETVSRVAASELRCAR